MTAETMTKMLEVFSQLGDGAQAAFITWVLATELSIVAISLIWATVVFFGIKAIIHAVFYVNENADCLHWVGRHLDVRMDIPITTSQRTRLKDVLIRATKQ